MEKSFKQALESMLAQLSPLPETKVGPESSLGCALARDLLATADSPPFDQSAMDGFGVKVADLTGASEGLPAVLSLAGTVCAGDETSRKLVSGSAVKLMTGAVVPSGVEAVVMKEFCREDDRSVYCSRAVSAGENIRKRGEEFCRGQKVLAAGSRITVPVVGLLASFGLDTVRVHRRPSVAIAAVGSELVGPDQPAGPGKIYDSNSFALVAACRELGIEDCQRFKVEDNRETISELLGRLLAEFDVLVTVGGISVGDHDLVRGVLAGLEVKELFWKVAIKPGKPFYAGLKVSGQRVIPVFGLPGNPVAALLCFYQFVKPALLRMMGVSSAGRILFNATLSTSLEKKAGRLAWIRGILSCDNGLLYVRPAAGQESHMLGGLAVANCLINFPASKTNLDEGEKVEVELLNWHG